MLAVRLTLVFWKVLEGPVGRPLRAVGGRSGIHVGLKGVWVRG